MCWVGDMTGESKEKNFSFGGPKKEVGITFKETTPTTEPCKKYILGQDTGFHLPRGDWGENWEKIGQVEEKIFTMKHQTGGEA